MPVRRVSKWIDLQLDFVGWVQKSLFESARTAHCLGLLGLYDWLCWRAYAMDKAYDAVYRWNGEEEWWKRSGLK